MVGVDIIIIFLILLNLINLYNSSFPNKNNLNNIINNNYQNTLQESIININLDEFITNIFNNTKIYYKLLILNDSEQIFFDYQSEFGCININFFRELKENKSFDFQFCAREEIIYLI